MFAQHNCRHATASQLFSPWYQSMHLLLQSLTMIELWNDERIETLTVAGVTRALS